MPATLTGQTSWKLEPFEFRVMNPLLCYILYSYHLWCNFLYWMHSPEVELIEIFVSNIFNGNGQVPSDIPHVTKNTTGRVHNF